MSQSKIDFMTLMLSEAPPLMTEPSPHGKVILASKVHGGMFSGDLQRSYIVANRSDPALDDGTQPRVGD